MKSLAFGLAPSDPERGWVRAGECLLVVGLLLVATPLFAKYNPLMQIEAQKIRPLLSLVIDTSGSMDHDYGGGVYEEGGCTRDADRIDVVRNLLIDTPNLFERDPNSGPCIPRKPLNLVKSMGHSMNVGLATFSSTATLAVPISPNDDMTLQDAQIKTVIDRIRQIRPSGSTNIGAGLIMGLENLRQAITTDKKQACGRKRFVILLTDGGNNQPSGGPIACHLQDADNDDVYDFDPHLRGFDDCSYARDGSLRQGDKCFIDETRPNDASQCLMYQTAEAAFRLGDGRIFPIALAEIANNSMILYTMNRLACLGGVDASMPNAGLDLDYSDFMAAHQLPGEDVPCGHQYLIYRTRCGIDPNDTEACQAVNHLGHLAFPAESPEKLRQTLETIVGLLAQGDFNSSRPTSVLIGQRGVAVFATTELPGWKGHLVRFDQDASDRDGDGDTEEFQDTPTWDAAEKLCELDDSPGCSASDLEARRIYFDRADSTRSLVALPTEPSLELSDSRVMDLLATARSVCPDAAWWDQSQDGCPNVLRTIDFLLGGEGTCERVNGDTYLLHHRPRPWLLGSIVGSQPVVVGKPLRYSLNRAPNKTGFDLQYMLRKPVVVVGSDDGMLHAFDLGDPRLQGRELWAFLPAPMLCQVPQRLAHYDPALAPTGQASTLDRHTFGINTTPVVVDIVDERLPDTHPRYPGRWKTVLFFGLAGGAGGAYAVDVTCAHPADPRCQGWDPPFTVQWYLPPGFYDGVQIGEIWQVLPVGLFTGERTPENRENNWAVALPSGLESQRDRYGVVLLEADLGPDGLLKAFPASSYYIDNPRLAEPEEGLIASPALMESDHDVYYHDSIVTNILIGDTSGTLHAMNTADEGDSDTGVSVPVWRYNDPPTFDLLSDPVQALHHDLAVAHLNQTYNYLVAFNTGSLFETESYYRGPDFAPKFGVRLFYIEQPDRDLHEILPRSESQRIFDVRTDLNQRLCQQVDPVTESCSQTVTPSPYARFTSEPFVVVHTGIPRKSGVILNLLFDPEVVSEVDTGAGPETVCGATFLVRIPFQADPQGSNGDQTVFTSATRVDLPRANIQLGAGVISGIGRTVTGAFIVQSGIGKGKRARPQRIEQAWSLKSAVIVRFKILF